MTEHHDPLKEAFSLLASASSADVRPNPDLEERLMNEANIGSRRPSRLVMLTVCSCLVAAAIGGTTVVAAGGVEAVRNWFATAEVIYPDGTKTELEVTPKGEVWLSPNQGLAAPPDQVEHLKGKKIKIFAAEPQTGE